MDVGMIMKVQGLWMKFTKNHPKFPLFINAMQKNKMPIDSIIELKITYPDGNVIETNLKIKNEDVELLEELKNLKK